MAPVTEEWKGSKVGEITKMLKEKEKRKEKEKGEGEGEKRVPTSIPELSLYYQISTRLDLQTKGQRKERG